MRKNNHHNLQNLVLFSIAILISLVILFIDSKLPLSIAFSSIYVVVILYSWLLPGLRTSIYLGIFCTLLMIIGFIVSPPSEIEGRFVGINCIVSLIVLWVTVALVAAAKRGFGSVERALEGLEDKVIERTAQLYESQAELRESERLYRYLYEHANEMYVSVNPEDATILKCNETLCNKLGYEKHELLGKPIFFVYHKDCLDDVKKAFQQFQETGQVNGVELMLKTRKGQNIDVILNVSSALDDAGNVLYSRSSWTDVTDYKKTQKVLKERGDMLESQNRELEQFVYIASHDLQEPLRTISSFTNLLHEQYSDKFDEAGKRGLQFILEASNRMRSLITDLLHYGRIGKNKFLEVVDCNKVLEDVKEDMASSLKDTAAELSIKELPKKIKVYPVEFHQLFQNLVSNAIKFQREEEIPKIEISCISKKGHWLFSIKDNGIGIGEDHKERIFKIFQRLHVRNEFEGTGIGLAHCKKIVELHKGEIWVESALNQGSTFYFTIPK